MPHNLNGNHTKGYDDFYNEANEFLNEVERKVWEYINEINNKY